MQQMVVDPVGERLLNEVVFDDIGVDEPVITEPGHLLLQHGRLTGARRARRHDRATPLTRWILQTQVPVNRAVVKAGPGDVIDRIPAMGGLV